MSQPMASVMTLVRGRQAHLDALISGLMQQTCQDFELIIASMQPEPPKLPAQTPFLIKLITVRGEPLPLAAARNAAAGLAESETLVFLDVDCIPSPHLVASYDEQLKRSGRCLLGEVRYLPGLVSRQEIIRQDFNTLASKALKHPARPALTEECCMAEPEHRALWGLSFALTRQHFDASGGMDEGYTGYGGEETDFAEKLSAAGIKLGWCANALALHQYHDVHTPPLEKFNSIVTNASRFHEKWGSWCMEYWLEQFVRLGLIRWSVDSVQIDVLRQPTVPEILNTRQGPEVAFA